jgi:hypothetical protein
MAEGTPSERLENALEVTPLFESLRQLAKTFKFEGMTQQDMYHLFDSYQAKHKNDADETKYNALLDTMDFIVGFCDAGAGIYDCK